MTLVFAAQTQTGATAGRVVEQGRSGIVLGGVVVVREVVGGVQVTAAADAVRMLEVMEVLLLLVLLLLMSR